MQVQRRQDATNWDEGAYRKRIFNERETSGLTVFRTAWAPSSSPFPDTLVVASSDGSISCYSIPSCLSRMPFNFKKTTHQHGFLQGHDGPAYDVKFYGNSDDGLLLSCGDDGRIRGWRWKKFMQSEVPFFFQGSHLKTILELVNPCHKGPWGAVYPIPENNSLAVNIQDGSIFSASGDSCAYCFDAETCKVKMVFRGHSEYLHCIVTRNSANQVVTGSEDGTARIWDCRSGKCVQIIGLQKSKKVKRSSYAVRCIALDESESWLVCGSGKSISVWNLPVSGCISKTSCHAIVQDVVFCDNQILAVGAEPQLSCFDMEGTLISQTSCAPQSSFSVALHTSRVTSVGGYGGLVDIFSPFGSHYFTFCCKSATEEI